MELLRENHALLKEQFSSYKLQSETERNLLINKLEHFTKYVGNKTAIFKEKIENRQAIVSNKIDNVTADALQKEECFNS